MDKKTQAAPPLKSFSDTVQAVRYGNLDAELAKEVASVMLACNLTGKKGSVTLKLSFAPGKAGQIEIEDKFTSVIPKLAQPTTLGFVAPDGSFTREDPRQVPIPGLLRPGQSLDTGTGEVTPAQVIPAPVVAALVAVK